uniref:uncharacterized protein n=1 Tax=Myxine glutinosa TaxID=7769 RepID=UPI00358FD7A6
MYILSWLSDVELSMFPAGFEWDVPPLKLPRRIMQGTQTALLAAIGTFRAGRVGEMRTLVGPQGMLVALQLALAQVNKETRGDFGAHPSEVLLHWRWLVCERLGLPVSEEPATDKASRVAQAYRQLLLRGNLIDLLDVFMNEPEPEAARPNAQTLCSFHHTEYFEAFFHRELWHVHERVFGLHKKGSITSMNVPSLRGMLSVTSCLQATPCLGITKRSTPGYSFQTRLLKDWEGEWKFGGCWMVDCSTLTCPTSKHLKLGFDQQRVRKNVLTTMGNKMWLIF